MLNRVEIENFYSIRDRQVLDLRVSGKAPDEPERFIPIYPGATERVPKVIATFGANGAGKSNSLRALAFLAWFIRDSFQLAPEAQIPLAPFYDQRSQERDTRLSLAIGGASDLENPDSQATTFGTYEYELEIGRSGQSNWVKRESLRHRIQGSRRSFRVFERSESGEVRDGVNFPLSRYHSVIDKIRPNASVISTLAQFDHGPSLSLRNAARAVYTNIFVVKQDYTDDQLLDLLANNEIMRSSLNREIPRVDLGIQDLQVVPSAPRSIVQFTHQGLDFPVSWPLESHGTQSFIRLFPLIAYAIESGGLAVIDEFDSSLHPLMLMEILQWFYDPVRNPKNARLWVTCQNASLLEELQKEEILICEKDDLGRTQIYGLQDVKGVGRLDNYYRKYLSGAYGGVPSFG